MGCYANCFCLSLMLLLSVRVCCTAAPRRCLFLPPPYPAPQVSGPRPRSRTLTSVHEAILEASTCACAPMPGPVPLCLCLPAFAHSAERKGRGRGGPCRVMLCHTTSYDMYKYAAPLPLACPPLPACEQSVPGPFQPPPPLVARPSPRHLSRRGMASYRYRGVVN